MAVPQGQEIVIQIDNLDQIFNPSPVNPFSTHEADILGEAALQRAVRDFLASGARPKRWSRLIFRLPAGQVTPDLQPRLVAGVRRYCQARIDDNHLKTRLGRTLSLVGLGLATAVVLVAGVLLYLVSIAVQPSEAAQSIVVGFFSVFVWVILWDPMNRLLFNWVQPFLENRILRRMLEMDITVEAQP